MKRYFLKTIHALLASLLVAMGFSSCRSRKVPVDKGDGYLEPNSEIKVMYGPPPAIFLEKGAER